MSDWDREERVRLLFDIRAGMKDRARHKHDSTIPMVCADREYGDAFTEIDSLINEYIDETLSENFK